MKKAFVDVDEARSIGARARMIRRRRGLSLEVVAGLAERDRRVVVDVLGVQRLDEAHVVGELPATPTGKVLKRELRAKYWASAERGVH